MSWMNYDVQQYLEGEILQPREKVVWKGRPDPVRSASISTTKFLFGIFFFGFAIFWTTQAYESGGFFALFGIPFIVVGFWMLIEPVRTYLAANKTFYAITDRRVLLLTLRRGYRVTSLVASDITDYERVDKQDGRGDIRLRKSLVMGRNGTRTTVGFLDGLWGIEDVRGASDAITGIRTAD